jgi:UDP-glucuronate decarboxylase
MRFLVTGAAGFLGSHLTDSLLKRGYSVIGLDNLSTGSLENLSGHISNHNFDFIEHDVREPFNFEVDFILNFACPASPIQYQADPVRTIETNFLGMKNALQLAKELRVPIMQASTSEIYGDPNITPQNEMYWGNVNPIGIRSCYDEGKRAAETLCFDYNRQYGVDIRVIRIFNTYGPRMAPDDGRVVSNFIVQALRNDPLTIYGDGSQSRSFCYVDDLVSGINKFIVHKPVGEPFPINLGNPNEVSMLELAKLVIEETKSSSEIIFLPLPLDDPKQRCPDTTRAFKELKWSPEINLRDGLLKTIAHFRNLKEHD